MIAFFTDISSHKNSPFWRKISNYWNNTHGYFTKHQKVRTVKLYMAKDFSRPLEDSVVEYHYHNCLLWRNVRVTSLVTKL